ncbi:hypothetical protein R8G64_15255 [Tenacibaculum maritimum]
MISGILYSVIERITSSLGILITGSDIQGDQYKEKSKNTEE